MYMYEVSQVALLVKNLPTNAGDVGLIPGSGRSPGGGHATHSSILAWRIPWTEEPAYSPQGHKESDKTGHPSAHTRMADSLCCAVGTNATL